MALVRQRPPAHTGTERYEIELRFEGNDQRLVDRMTDPGHMVPDRIFLVWTRRVGGQWERVVQGVNGSHAVGLVKLSHEEQESGVPAKRQAREIFHRQIPALREWTLYLPGLRPAIEEEEARLPR